MSLRFVMLTLLNTQSQSGYDIVKSFDNTIRYFWHASHQQVYRELNTLELQKWVTHQLIAQQGKPDKKCFSITALGRTALHEWLSKPLSLPANRDALLVKLLSVESVGSSVIKTSIQHQQLQISQQLKTYKDIERNFYDPPPGPGWPVYQRMLYLALRKGIVMAEAELQWLAQAMEQLQDM